MFFISQPSTESREPVLDIESPQGRLCRFSTRRIDSYTLWRMLLPTMRIAEKCLSILFAHYYYTLSNQLLVIFIYCSSVNTERNVSSGTEDAQMNNNQISEVIECSGSFH